jgi:hypothetical protein
VQHSFRGVFDSNEASIGERRPGGGLRCHDQFLVTQRSSRAEYIDADNAGGREGTYERVLIRRVFMKSSEVMSARDESVHTPALAKNTSKRPSSFRILSQS